MKVYEAVANAFVKEGTSTVFGLLGDGQLSWWSAMSKHSGIRIIDARHEGAALTMAEGWAMATGKIGVCSVTHGPGVSHMTTSLITATRSRTPVLIFTSKTAFNNEHSIQYLDQETLVGATGAGYIEVLTPSFAENAVRQAFYRARLESRPIVLSVVGEIQDKECDSEGDDYQPSSTMFSGQQRIRPDVDRLDKAVNIISESKKPVIVVGRGAMKSQAAEAVDRLAKRIGALIATTLPAKGVLGECEYHAGIAGQFSTRTAIHLFEETDCVIALGASLNLRTIEGGYLFPLARIVHIDVAPNILMGNDKVADCYIQGDAVVTAQAIDEMLAQKGVSKEGYRTASVRKSLRDAGRDPGEFEIEPGTVDPREAARVMDEHLPSNIGLITDVGHFFSFPVLMMKKPRALQMFTTSFGCIGQALATAIGVGVAAGEPLACVEGDGGAMQNIQELDTAARLGLKLLLIVMNDEALGAEYHKLKAKGGDVNLAAVRAPDFGAVGRGFGCRGRMARTLNEVAAGIDEFLAGDGPMVLDIRISRNVVSIPYRRLHFGQDV
ncbi:MAG: thiamine pyrophosphate-binding protein [Betaproteobacteria bacterium]|nr:thiamine pyrophosphate-binding protein [Betaproteobacteria bacterium]